MYCKMGKDMFHVRIVNNQSEDHKKVSFVGLKRAAFILFYFFSPFSSLESKSTYLSEGKKKKCASS